jgi:hypothetical protein
LTVERVIDRDGERLRSCLYGEHQVLEGKGLGNGLGDHLQIQLQGIDLLERQPQLFRNRPHDGLFIQTPLGPFLRLEAHGSDDIDRGDGLMATAAEGTGVALEALHLLQVLLVHGGGLHDEGFLGLGNETPLCQQVAQVGDIHGHARHGGGLAVPSRGRGRGFRLSLS